MEGPVFADLRIPGGECGGRSVCRFKDSGTGGSVFADLRIPGRIFRSLTVGGVRAWELTNAP